MIPNPSNFLAAILIYQPEFNIPKAGQPILPVSASVVYGKPWSEGYGCLFSKVGENGFSSRFAEVGILFSPK